MKKLLLGFTGTQEGMTESQKAHLIFYLNKWAQHFEALEAHHGDCIGADEEFHQLLQAHWPHELVIIIHPPVETIKRAYCKGDMSHSPLPYLKRNHVIVDSVDYMLAAPNSTTEQLRSGTWATIRYSRKTATPIRLLNR